MSIGNWYRVGTVSVQNGNVNVVGTNTFWTTQCNPGDRFTVDGENWYEIVTITDDTHLAIESVGGSGAFAGATAANLPYAIDRNFNNALSGGLAAQVAALLAQFQAGANGPLSGLFQNGSAATPGIAFLNEASTGLFRPAAGIAALAVQGAEFLRAVGTVNGVPAMLGLGTATPAQMVDLAASYSALWGVRMTNSSAGTAARAGFIAGNGAQNLNIGVNGASFTANGVLTPARGFVEGPSGIDFASGVTAGNAFTWGVGASYASKMAMDYQGNVTLTGGTLTLADGSSIGATGYSNAGTYTLSSASLAPVQISPVINYNSGIATSPNAVAIASTFNIVSPTVGSPAALNTVAVLGTGSATIFNFRAQSVTASLGALYTGVVSEVSGITINQVTTGGVTALVYNGLDVRGVTSHGNGITAGMVTNTGINIGSNAVSAGAGGTLVNNNIAVALGSGSGAGNTTNVGLRITGNGGSGGAGTTTNFALYADSTAPSYIAGNLVVGSVASTTNGAHYFVKVVTADAGQAIARFGNDTNSSVIIYSASAAGYNAGNAAMKVGKDNVTGYSIRPGGTVASPGNDYAEYRQLIPALYGAVAKGTLLGYDANGLMTNVFAHVVGRVLPKSTDPSYVGGDTWGLEAAIVANYGVTAPGDPPDPVPVPVAPAVIADPGPETTEKQADAYSAYQQAAVLYPQWQTTYATYQTDLAAHEATVAAFNAALETERLKWDRIALCGVVPVNLAGLTAADVGKYLVPCAAPDGTITATAVARSDLSLGQYIDSFGTIERIGADGRPLVNVKNG